MHSRIAAVVLASAAITACATGSRSTAAPSIEITTGFQEIYAVYSQPGLVRGAKSSRSSIMLTRLKLTNTSQHEQRIRSCQISFFGNKTLFQTGFLNEETLKRETAAAKQYISNINFQTLIKGDGFYDSAQVIDTLSLAPGQSFMIFRQYFDLTAQEPVDRLRISCDTDTTSAVTDIPIVQYSNKNHYRFPLNGDFLLIGNVYDVWGHRSKPWEEFGLDAVALGPNQRVYNKTITRNRDHYVFGREVIAPADGTVVKVYDGLEDNPVPCDRAKIDEHIAKVGKSFPLFQRLSGNQVVIEHPNGEFSHLVHLKTHSILVKVGDAVRQGQTIGKVGNSGDGSNGPHLHYHLSNGPDALKARSLPVKFDNVENSYFSTLFMDKQGIPKDIRHVFDQSGGLLVHAQ